MPCSALLFALAVLMLPAVLCGGASEATQKTASAEPVLRKVASFEIPGPPGKRFDYLTVLAERHLLFSTHLGAGRLYVIDTTSNKVIKTIEDLPGIEAVAVASDVNKAYTSNW